MAATTRRSFLLSTISRAASAAAALSFEDLLAATPARVAIGLQLYTVREELKKDLTGTLRAVAAIGYRLIELGEDDLPAEALRNAISAAGLTCLGGLCQTHHLAEQADATIARAKTLGYRYLSCAWPQGLDSGFRVIPTRTAGALTLDDYRRLADLFNRVGEKCHAAEIQLVYHSHNFEFRSIDGTEPFDLLVRQTQPNTLQIELDTYWVGRAGRDPVEFFRKYPGRVATLHIKDMKPVSGPTYDADAGRDAFIEVGRGMMDWKRILSAADQAGAQYAFAEQDSSDHPAIESARISFEYLKSIGRI